MPKDINQAELAGRLVRDPELRYTQTGKPVCNVSIVTSRWIGSANGEGREASEFHNLVGWTDLATQLAELRKGDRVHIKGRIQSRSWEGQDGQKRRTVEVVVEEILPADARTAAAAPAALDEAIG
jgi:single-strand DNA-binding protein